jgi:hypothetical protein
METIMATAYPKIVWRGTKDYSGWSLNHNDGTYTECGCDYWEALRILDAESTRMDSLAVIDPRD